MIGSRELAQKSDALAMVKKQCHISKQPLTLQKLKS